jgi:hypothetical protein
MSLFNSNEKSYLEIRNRSGKSRVWLPMMYMKQNGLAVNSKELTKFYVIGKNIVRQIAPNCDAKKKG